MLRPLPVAPVARCARLRPVRFIFVNTPPNLIVGYDSTNIFRIWMPQKRKVIRAKDVIVDENKFYDPETPYIEELLQEAVPGKRFTQDIPDFRGRDESNPFGADESSSEEEEEVYSTKQDTARAEAANEESRSNLQLITPDITPEPVLHIGKSLAM